MICDYCGQECGALQVDPILGVACVRCIDRAKSCIECRSGMPNQCETHQCIFDFKNHAFCQLVWHMKEDKERKK